jgi:hypothetical protein
MLKVFARNYRSSDEEGRRGEGRRRDSDEDVWLGLQRRRLETKRQEAIPDCCREGPHY